MDDAWVAKSIEKSGIWNDILIQAGLNHAATSINIENRDHGRNLHIPNIIPLGFDYCKVVDVVEVASDRNWYEFFDYADEDPTNWRIFRSFEFVY